MDEMGSRRRWLVALQWLGALVAFTCLIRPASPPFMMLPQATGILGLGFELFIVGFAPLWIPCAFLVYALVRQRFSLQVLFILIAAEAVGIALCLSFWRRPYLL